MLNTTLSNFTGNPFVVCGVVFTLLVSLLGLFSPLIGPYDPLDQQLRLRHVPPLSTGTARDRTADPPVEKERFFVLGTDHLGRDVLSRLIPSFRVYVYSGLLAWGLSTVLAWLLVAIQGGPTEAADSSQRRSFPWAVLNSSPLVLVAIILGVSYLLLWSYIRISLIVFETGPSPINMVLFSGIMSAFILAALLYQALRQTLRAKASSPTPSGNWVWPMVRQTFLLAPVSLSLAVLISLFIEYPWSFLGFGVQPPQSSLALLFSQGIQYLLAAWWVAWIPLILMAMSIGAFLAITLPLSRSQNRYLYRLRDDSAGVSQPSAESAPHLDRLGAFMIDLILAWLLNFVVPMILTILVIMLIYVVQNSTLINWLLDPGLQILAYVLIIGYFPFFWATSGQTPGMKIFGIKVVRTDTTPVPVHRAALRLIGLVISGAILLLGLIWVLFDERRQGWHDKMAGTLVVRVEPATQ